MQSRNKYLKVFLKDFPGGPVVKNPPSNARDAGSIPGQGTKTPHAAGLALLYSPRATIRDKPTHHKEEPACHNERSHVPQLRPDAAK